MDDHSARPGPSVFQGVGDYKVSELMKAEIGTQGKEAVRLLRLVTAFSVTTKYRQMLASP